MCFINESWGIYEREKETIFFLMEQMQTTALCYVSARLDALNLFTLKVRK